MISFSIAPKLLALCFLLILYTSADDSDLTDPPLAQKTAAGFSPSLSDGALGSVGNQPIIENEGSLGQLSDTLIETPKSLLLTDSESTNCAGSPDVPHKRSRRSSRGLGKRQQHDFCSVQDPEKLKLAPPSEPRADDIPAGQQGKAGIGRPRGSMGGPDGFIPDPMLNLKESQLYGNPNPALCPNGNMNVPVCTPYDQKFTSPAPILVPSRFWKPDDWCSDMEGTWEDLWCCAYAYVHRSIGWELNVVFTRYPSTGIKCMLLRNHYTDN